MIHECIYIFILMFLSSLEKYPEVELLDCMFTGRTDAKAETPILWPPHAKSWLIRKDSYARRDWGQEEKGMTEDEMAGWHHQLDGRESEWTQGVGDGQGGLACCDSWGRKDSDMTERLNWTELTVARFLIFWGTSILSSIVVAPTGIHTSNARGFPFLSAFTSVSF